MTAQETHARVMQTVCACYNIIFYILASSARVSQHTLANNNTLSKIRYKLEDTLQRRNVVSYFSQGTVLSKLVGKHCEMCILTLRGVKACKSDEQAAKWVLKAIRLLVGSESD